MTDEGVTDHCNLGFRCESCGGANGGLNVKIYKVLGASMCLTVCSSCAGSGKPPQVMLSTAEKLVAQHSKHLAGFPTHHPRT